MKRKHACGMAMVAALSLVGFTLPAYAQKTIRVSGGQPVENLSLAFDASYDSRLDRLVPGYRVVNVVIVNNSFEIIPLSPDQDRWYVITGKNARRHRATIDLRRADPAAWSAVPEGARGLLAYPLAIPIGARMVIDLFVKKDVPLEQFTGIVVDLRALNLKIEVMARE